MNENAGRTSSTEAPEDFLSSAWRRLKEHRIAQWTVSYIAVAYGIQHAVTLTSEAYTWPSIVIRLSMTVLALGLPIAMALAWYHGQRANHRISSGEAAIVSLLLVIVSFAFYSVVRPASDTARAVSAASIAATTPRNGISLVVLPFTNMSGDSGQEFFSDGMTEEITAALAKVPGLRVVGRTSAFQFKGEKKDLRAIGQALAATHLIEGSVRKEGDQVRITAQLIKADDGTHLWAESYDRELKGIFAVQEDIAQAIAMSLRVPLGLQRGQKLISSRDIDPQTYQQYLRGKALVRSAGTRNALADGAALLEQVVAHDPGYAPAWALLAHDYAVTPAFDATWLNDSTDELRRLVSATLPRAESAARRSIELDPTLPDGYTQLASVNHYRGHFVQADQLYSKAMALDPSNADVLFSYGQMLAQAGRLKDALAMVQQAQLLDPFVPVIKGNVPLLQWIAGQTETAIAVLNVLPPSDVFRGYYLPRMYAAAGRYAEAIDALRKAPFAYTPGTREAAIELLGRAPKPVASPQKLPRLGNMEFVYLHVGATDRVLEFHEDILSAGYPLSVATAWVWHASYAPVRKTKRFKAYVQKLGLVEYWRAKGWPEFCHPTTGDDFECS